MRTEVKKVWTVQGFICLVVMNGMRGSIPDYFCGYVGVPKGHRLNGVDMESDAHDISVHGGITWCGELPNKGCWPEDMDSPPEGTWWVGFDCCHGFDLDDQKDETYVVKETERLANQLSEWT